MSKTNNLLVTLLGLLLAVMAMANHKVIENFVDVTTTSFPVAVSADGKRRSLAGMNMPYSASSRRSMLPSMPLVKNALRQPDSSTEGAQKAQGQSVARYSLSAFDNVKVEGYCNSGGCNSSVAPSSANASASVSSSASASSSNVLDSLPVGNMEVVGSDGNTQQVFVQQQFAYTTRKNRLRGQADHIRGDLYIAPAVIQSVSTHANMRNLNPGALAVMGGIHNENNAQLNAMITSGLGRSVPLSGLAYPVDTVDSQYSGNRLSGLAFSKGQ